MARRNEPWQHDNLKEHGIATTVTQRKTGNIAKSVPLAPRMSHAEVQREHACAHVQISQAGMYSLTYPLVSAVIFTGYPNATLA